MNKNVAVFLRLYGMISFALFVPLNNGVILASATRSSAATKTTTCATSTLSSRVSWTTRSTKSPAVASVDTRREQRRRHRRQGRRGAKADTPSSTSLLRARAAPRAWRRNWTRLRRANVARAEQRQWRESRPRANLLPEKWKQCFEVHNNNNTNSSSNNNNRLTSLSSLWTTRCWPRTSSRGGPGRRRYLKKLLTLWLPFRRLTLKNIYRDSRLGVLQGQAHRPSIWVRVLPTPQVRPWVSMTLVILWMTTRYFHFFLFQTSFL